MTSDECRYFRIHKKIIYVWVDTFIPTFNHTGVTRMIGKILLERGYNLDIWEFRARVDLGHGVCSVKNPEILTVEYDEEIAEKLFELQYEENKSAVMLHKLEF
jgi:hypothetical protein